MEMLSSSSPLPLHHDELYMQQKMIFSDSLKELKNMRKQLYSAAEYFEVSYRKGDQKQIVVETLKDYTIKALINSVDHLGSMGDKINKFMDEKNIDVSSVDLKLCSIEQKVRTCQGYTDRGGIFQQSLTLGCSKHHKRYIIPVEATTNAINQSNNMISHSAEDDSVKFHNVKHRDTTAKLNREQRSISAQTPRSSSPKTFQLKRTASIPDMKELSSYHFPVKRSGSVVKRSMTINSSTSKQQYPKESWRSSSMSTRQERDRAKSPELHSGLNKRLLKALVSIRKYRKDATLQKHSNEK
ncbi:protein ABIL3 isoform X1 [Cannabis sativa]|uniref:protein ABIL3 isoform X1 n=1 Tax=Cannabis sativa TaxID=3483 RepID=UPI0029CA112C|nr:protein ABIL3 isoform X1 [Cannabis sativa]